MLIYFIWSLLFFFFSISRSTYKGRQLHDPDNEISGKLVALNLGKKENTGHTDNNQSYTLKPIDSNQFATIYRNTYHDKNQIPRTEYSRINDACTRDIQENGFTKSEKLHPVTDNYDESRQLKFLHPYVNRSLKARDPFYAENKYAHKERQPLVLAWFKFDNTVFGILVKLNTRLVENLSLLVP